MVLGQGGKGPYPPLSCLRYPSNLHILSRLCVDMGVRYCFEDLSFLSKRAPQSGTRALMEYICLLREDWCPHIPNTNIIYVCNSYQIQGYIIRSSIWYKNWESNGKWDLSYVCDGVLDITWGRFDIVWRDGWCRVRWVTSPHVQTYKGGVLRDYLYGSKWERVTRM